VHGNNWSGLLALEFFINGFLIVAAAAILYETWVYDCGRLGTQFAQIPGLRHKDSSVTEQGGHLRNKPTSRKCVSARFVSFFVVFHNRRLPAHTRTQVMNITRNGDGSYCEGAALLLFGGWEVRR